MAVKASDTITLIRVDDGAKGDTGILVSSTAPSNPVIGQLWQNPSTNIIKKWNGSTWAIWHMDVNNLNVDKLSAITTDLGEVTHGVISSINLSKENIAIKADKISLEGVVTANDNFKILKDGSIECKNGAYSGDVVAENILVNEKLKLYIEDPNIEGGSGYLTAVEMGVHSGDHVWVRFGSPVNTNVYYDNYNQFISYHAYQHYLTGIGDSVSSTDIVLDATTTIVKGDLQVDGRIHDLPRPRQIGATIARDYTKVATINVQDYTSFILQSCAQDGRVLASIEIFTSQIVYGRAGACIAAYAREPNNYSAYAYFLNDGSLYLSGISNFDKAIMWGRPK